MNKRKCTQTLCLSAAALLFCVIGQGEASADSFLNPARNAYSLDKTADRPFLQNNPVPQVWQMDSSSEEFRRALLDAVLPETLEERQLKAVEQYEAADEQWNFQTIVIEDQKAENRIAADLLSDIVPIVAEADNTASFDLEKADADYANRQLDAAQGETDRLIRQLLETQAFINALQETALIDLDLSVLEEFFEGTDRQERRIITETKEAFLPDSVLEKAQDIYAPETKNMQGVREIDEMLWSLLFNDMLDLSTGVDMLMYDDAYPKGEKAENTRRSLSLLDRDEKTDQIQENSLSAQKKALIKRLQKKLKGDKTKGVK
ncbi:MAG: hypothetical protein IJ752_05670 [Alphaproteobacteria bacterium]|nr:hypothetical protein [Alphaproteobacteria bacterium]